MARQTFGSLDAGLRRTARCPAGLTPRRTPAPIGSPARPPRSRPGGGAGAGGSPTPPLSISALRRTHLTAAPGCRARAARHIGAKTMTGTAQQHRPSRCRSLKPIPITHRLLRAAFTAGEKSTETNRRHPAPAPIDPGVPAAGCRTQAAATINGPRGFLADAEAQAMLQAPRMAQIERARAGASTPDQRLLPPAPPTPSWQLRRCPGPRLRYSIQNASGGWRWRTAASTQPASGCLSWSRRVLMLKMRRPAGGDACARPTRLEALQKQPSTRGDAIHAKFEQRPRGEPVVAE